MSADKIEFTLRYQNLSGPPAAAHIHFGQARTNGGVMVFFCGGGSQSGIILANGGKLASVSIGGSLIGGPNVDSGEINSGADMGQVTIGRDLQGDSGGDPLVTVEGALEPPDHRLRQAHG